MKIFLRIASIGLIILASFVVYTFTTTGFFRTIDYHFEGEIVKEISLAGAEDITTSLVDSFALISSTDRRMYPPADKESGGLYLMDLKSGDFSIKHLSSNLSIDFAPHGISMFKTDSTYTVMVINHTAQGNSIEVFELIADQMTHKKTLTDKTMISPNDLVMLDENRFYFTNDHRYTGGLGRLIEEYGGRAISNVVYFDGAHYKEVADGIAYANGINYDSKRNLLYVAATRSFETKVYLRNKEGSLRFIEDIPCGFGVDNIEIDALGNLWIGGHPNLLRFQAYAQGKKDIAPSEIIKISYNGEHHYEVKSIFTEEGSLLSGASVASPFGDYIFAGTVMDDKVLILKQKNSVE